MATARRLGTSAQRSPGEPKPWGPRFFSPPRHLYSINIIYKAKRGDAVQNRIFRMNYFPVIGLFFRMKYFPDEIFAGRTIFQTNYFPDDRFSGRAFQTNNFPGLHFLDELLFCDELFSGRTVFRTKYFPDELFFGRAIFRTIFPD